MPGVTGTRLRLLVPGLVAAVALAACGSVPPAGPPTQAATTEAAITSAAAAAATTAPTAATAPAPAIASTGGPAASAQVGAPASSSAAGSVATVTARTLALRLPAGRSRTVVAIDGTSLLIVGGLTARGTTGSILRVVPSTGGVASVGRLVSPVHDAAGAQLRGRWLVLGGGRVLAVRDVQRLAAMGASTAVHVAAAGSLPAARADHVAVSVGGEVVVAGGGRGGVADPAVLATVNGSTFRVIARLPVAVRYPAVATLGGLVYLFGGSTASGDTAVIQVINPVTGRARVVGRLPRTLSGAAAFVLGGRIFVAGGDHAGRAVDAILVFDPSTGRTGPAGHLPAARADAGVAVIGNVAYLVGGEAGRYLDTVVRITAG